MPGYLFNRIVQIVMVLGIMSFVIYGLIGLMPGDPIDLMISADPDLTSEDAERLYRLYGLDQPIITRYGNWLQAFLSGDLGYSRLYGKPVLAAIEPAFLNTLKLLGLSFILSIVIGICTGVWASSRPYTVTDYSINFIAFAGISIPSFWLALLLIIFFSVILGVLPAGGIGDVHSAGGWWDSAKYLVLPVASLTIASVGGHTRYMRAAMMEVLRQDFIRTARAKGLSRWQTLYRHAFRNAMIPVVTIIALDFGFLFSGALITETVFGYPGMGKLIYDSIMGNDFNLALATLLLATSITLFGNLCADIAYGALDPRIRLRGKSP